MPDAIALAAAYGVRVELADLGDWAAVTLVAEYDPAGPVIRVNERALCRILRQAQDDEGPERRRRAIDRAVAHELYHHREAIGEIARIPDRVRRERAADAFADDLVRTP